MTSVALAGGGRGASLSAKLSASPSRLPSFASPSFILKLYTSLVSVSGGDVGAYASCLQNYYDMRTRRPSGSGLCAVCVPRCACQRVRGGL